ncbi:MAG: 16S rRNA (cytosine(1402)-N(4))-methyltransferase RsmH [Bdellovibrionales bacterium]|nr:16S rRNA (cytosine(1402)-N(4))-methyltransferase RsmH [Bdellovibrionales bacterium]
MKHIPVLFEDVILNMHAHKDRVRWILDGTFGRGGHAVGMLKECQQAHLIGVDRDHEAIEFGCQHFKKEIDERRLYLLRGNYAQLSDLNAEIESIMGTQLFDVILLDLGVSSPQLDQPERGFSFYHDGPLDMRMDQRDETTAADILNTWSDKELSDLFFQLGEIRRPNRVVKRIIERRREKLFESTLELAHLIEMAEGWTRKGHHPATNYFMALRIQVNHELEQVEQMVQPLVERLNACGRLLVITFHSTEDRIVKLSFKKLKEDGVGTLVNKKVIQAGWSEKKANPRARSAKLRIFEKGVETNES